MKKSLTRFLPLLALLLAAGACSVREDRQPCPCYLTLVLREAGEQLLAYGMDSLSLAAAGDTDYRQNEAVRADSCHTGREWQTPKQWIRLGAYAGSENLQPTQDALLIPYGTEADSLFGYGARVDCNGETAVDTVRLHKQFATLTLILTGATEADPMILETESRWAGWDLLDFTPVIGRFRATATLTDTGTYRIRLPRQGDDGLLLHLAGRNGEPLKSFPIGEEIAAEGYDWQAPDLDDLLITIDFARATVSVSISGWDDGGSQQYDI